MKNSVYITLLTAGMAALAATPAWSADDMELLKCRAIQDASTRLACYDGYVEKSMARASEAPGGQALSVAELKVDGAALRGKDVVTDGFMMVMGEQGILAEARGSMTSVFVAFAKLPREQRLAAFQNCSTGCSVSVAGKVTDFLGNTAIDATSLTLK